MLTTTMGAFFRRQSILRRGWLAVPPRLSSSMHLSTGAPLVGVAAGVSLFFLLEEIKPTVAEPPTLMKRSTRFSNLDHSYPLQLQGKRAPRQENALPSQPVVFPFEKDISELSRKLSSWWQPRIRENEDGIQSAGKYRQEQLASTDANAAQFPTLRSKLVTSDIGSIEASTAFPINSKKKILIDNDLFIGEVSLVLRPVQPEHDPDFGDTSLSLKQRYLLNCDSNENKADEEPPTFFFTLKGQFKRRVRKDALFVGGELADPYVMTRTLSSLSRRIAAWLLRLLSIHVGTGMSYSFGGSSSSKKLPHIAFPVLSAMDVQEEERGDTISTAHTNDQYLQDYWEPEKVYTFMYEASSIDLATWKVLFPIEMDVSKFWGNSPLRLVIYEESERSSSNESSVTSNNYLLQLQLEHQEMVEEESLVCPQLAQPSLSTVSG